MAPRNRRSAAEPVEEEEEELQDALPRLKFKDALSWRAGRPIQLADLLRRLKELATELQELDQDEVDRKSLTDTAKELAFHNLLVHKDGGVKAWTACCLVEMFRLCAPDAPYTATQLKVLRVFANAIDSIADLYRTSSASLLRP